MSGEFSMLVLDCGGFTVRRQKQPNAPLAHVIPEDAPTAVFWHMGVPRNAAHPNLAKLWINMMLSEEGQRTIYETDATDHYALPGSQSAAELSELRAKGIEPLRLSVQFVVDHPEMRQLNDDLVKILREQQGR